METERIALSQRERDRLKVLHDVKEKHLTQVAAGRRLNLTDRHVRRLLLSLQERGDAAVVHGLRGQPSNRKLAAAFEQKILTRVRQRYADFGHTLAAEHLAQEGLLGSRETLRKWMAKAALWRPRRQRVKAIHVWRERRASFGELVMQDSSPFRWFEKRGLTSYSRLPLAMARDGNAAQGVRENESKDECAVGGNYLVRDLLGAVPGAGL